MSLLERVIKYREFQESEFKKFLEAVLTQQPAPAPAPPPPPINPDNQYTFLAHESVYQIQSEELDTKRAS